MCQGRTWKWLLLGLAVIVNIPASQAQCEAKPENYYAPSGDPYFVSEKVVPSEPSLNMFKYLELLRAEFWYAATMNTTITRADDPGCVYVGTGISLEDIKYLDPTWEIPILTNVRIIGQKIFIPGKTNTFVTKEQFERLVGILGLKSTVLLNKNPRVMVTISKKTLSNYDVEIMNSCQMEGLALNLRLQMHAMLTTVHRTWQRFLSTLKFFGQDRAILALSQCCQDKDFAIFAINHISARIYF